MFSLAHISDIHLGPLPEPRKRDLISKRLTGYANWHMNRSKTHGSDALNILLSDINAKKPDHIAITGDLVNLALRQEFETSSAWLKALGQSDRISVVPGNHDAYVPGALTSAYKAWGNYMPVAVQKPDGDDAVDAGFPYLRRVGPVAIIGVSSAVASIPFLSTGRFREDQASRLDSALRDAAKDGLFRVVLIHHPPFRYHGDAAKRLYGIRLFQRIIVEAGAELILHGHTHIPSFEQIGKGTKAVPVIGVPSASQSIGGHRPAARWNEFKISGGPNLWDCQWIERGILGDGAVYELATRPIWSDGNAVDKNVVKAVSVLT